MYNHPDKLVRQKTYDDRNHHPLEKKNQINNIIHLINNKKILEVFAGKGNMTTVYNNLGSYVKSLTYETHGCSYKYIKKISIKNNRYKQKYDVIDIDGYGFSEKLFPHIFNLIQHYGTLIYTAPRQCAPISNKDRDLYERMFNVRRYPRLDDIYDGLNRYANICNMNITRVNAFEISHTNNQGGITRQVFRVKKLKI